ncbi:hypothetical protein SJAG_01273 [Schizosaccharomyces japonicus yFS275]|uniref:Uncharacterized protein n=1 Tax=Schizosaccharomyces japonicus (strain yFS275 / FY16936) TaxID=402676 RepID=B6K081_SCHJY|nr:hypothetical protein SJAG_01273 [Schizosaccharomyces japonicus yFS275]EEB06231.1 hypothetical protein SJAG_01273 [Schizosaccharomyces japonicus yFS275]
MLLNDWRLQRKNKRRLSPEEARKEFEKSMLGGHIGRGPAGFHRLDDPITDMLTGGLFTQHGPLEQEFIPTRSDETTMQTEVELLFPRVDKRQPLRDDNSSPSTFVSNSHPWSKDKNNTENAPTLVNNHTTVSGIPIICSKEDLFTKEKRDERRMKILELFSDDKNMTPKTRSACKNVTRQLVDEIDYLVENVDQKNKEIQELKEQLKQSHYTEEKANFQLTAAVEGMKSVKDCYVQYLERSQIEFNQLKSAFSNQSMTLSNIQAELRNTQEAYHSMIEQNSRQLSAVNLFFEQHLLKRAELMKELLTTKERLNNVEQQLKEITFTQEQNEQRGKMLKESRTKVLKQLCDEFSNNFQASLNTNDWKTYCCKLNTIFQKVVRENQTQ